MEELKVEKTHSIDEQIKFVHDARRLLDNNPDAEIQWHADSVEQLRSIEMSLVTLKKCEEVSEVMVQSILNAEVQCHKKIEMPVGTEVSVEVGERKTEWVQGVVKHYDDGFPVVMLYYGQTYLVRDASKIKEVCHEE